MTGEDPGDAAIVASLAASPARSWKRLFAVAGALGTGGGHVSWTEPVHQQDGSIVLGYPVYSAELQEIQQLLYDLGVIVPFDWMTWQGAGRYPGGRGLEEAPVADAARLATAIVRGERFGDGVIAEAVSDGTLTAILARLRRWFETERPVRSR